MSEDYLQNSVKKEKIRRQFYREFDNDLSKAEIGDSIRAKNVTGRIKHVQDDKIEARINHQKIGEFEVTVHLDYYAENRNKWEIKHAEEKKVDADD